MKTIALLTLFSGCAWFKNAAPGLEECQTSAAKSVIADIEPIVSELLANGSTSEATQAALEALGVQVTEQDVLCSISALSLGITPTPAIPSTTTRANVEAWKFVQRHTAVIVK